MELAGVVDRLADRYAGLSPQLRVAAKYVLDHPAEVGLRSMRRVAGEAAVPPSTMTRLARALDYSDYETFRQPFQDALRGQAGRYQKRAKDLQSRANGGRGDDLVDEMLNSNLAGIKGLADTIDSARLQAAARRLTGARRVYVLGLRGCFSLAHYFYYVARLAMPGLVLLRGQAGPPIDELAEAGQDDVLLTIAFEPYTRETVRAAHFANRQGVQVIALTDSRASPLVPGAAEVLIAATRSPQFFPSALTTVALIEALIAVVVAQGGSDVLQRIARNERILREEGAYWRDDMLAAR